MISIIYELHARSKSKSKGFIWKKSESALNILTEARRIINKQMHYSKLGLDTRMSVWIEERKG